MSVLETDIHNTVSCIHPQEWSVAIINGQGKEPVAGKSPNQRFEAASLNKLAIAHAALHSYHDFGTGVTLEESDMRVQGEGILHRYGKGHKLTFARVIEHMLSRSDETAARAAVRVMGGPNEVNERLDSKASRLALRHVLTVTRLAPVDDGTSSDSLFRYGKTTALETAILMDRVRCHPTFGDALRKGIFRDGLRRSIDPSGRGNYFLYQASRLAHFATRVGVAIPPEFLEDPRPRGDIPNKQGHDHDPETLGLHHDVATITRGGETLTVAALSRGYGNRCAEANLVLDLIGMAVAKHAGAS